MSTKYSYKDHSQGFTLPLRPAHVSVYEKRITQRNVVVVCKPLCVDLYKVVIFYSVGGNTTLTPRVFPFKTVPSVSWFKKKKHAKLSVIETDDPW